MFSKLALGSAMVSAISGADTNAWKGRAVYQLLTDRYA